MKKKTVFLIVEDEGIIRMGAVQMLEDAGFATVEAGNADDAMRILESRSDIRAVFTDIIMPGTLNGLRLAHTVRGRWPPIHLILTSGHISRESVFPAGGKFIRKPYWPEHVIATLHELLGLNSPRHPVSEAA